MPKKTTGKTKAIKKLTLKRETIRDLDAKRAARNVKGGQVRLSSPMFGKC